MADKPIARDATSVRLLTDVGARHGLSVRTCLAGSGMSERELQDPAVTIDPEQEKVVIRNLVTNLSSVAALGLEAGMRYHFTMFGMLGFAWASSPNLRSAFDIGLKFFKLTFAFTDFQYVETNDEIHVFISTTSNIADITRFLLERDSAALIRVQRDLLPDSGVVRSIHYPFPASAQTDRYQTLLGIRPVFGASRCVVILDRAALMRPLPQANVNACRAAEEQCRLILDRNLSRRGMSGIVRARLLRDSSRMADMEGIARELCMTPRTLRRRLEAEGTTFSEIREDVRSGLAEDLLRQTDLTIGEIAYRLSYSQATCFINAFKSWRGVTPLAFRKRQG
ncbi:MAG: helix-turn-helix domain-containing protein [Telmatospirillum sp.]|nr:helix-turn-helix domain-containing protein [Telmatospirillum sp.]